MKKRKSLIAVASLATMISLAAPVVANAATDTDTTTDAATDSNTEPTLIFVPWYAADSKAEEEISLRTH